MEQPALRERSTAGRRRDRAGHSAVAVGVSPPPAVEVNELAKTFRRRGGATVRAIDHVSLKVEPGEFVILLGPSGCGKTTLLRSIAGLDRPDEGSITIGGATVFSSGSTVNLPAERRPVSMIFQSYALWPHMTVGENVAYPLKVRKVRRPETRERVNDVLRTVGISELASQYPGQLSGGQQQRVALARAIVAGEQLVLFDEPLSNVDAKVREHLRVELLTMQSQLGFAAVYVTHDQQEAMELGDRIAVLGNGRIIQVAPPREVYDAPATKEVADFVGKINFVPGVVDAVDSGWCQVASDLGPMRAKRPDAGLEPGSPCVVGFRPESASISIDRPSGPAWDGVVEAEMFVAPHWEYVVAVGPGLRFRINSASALPPGSSSCWVSVPEARCRALRDDRAASDSSPGQVDG